MTARLIAFVLLGGLCAAAQTPPAESGVVLVSLIDRPVGRETYSIWPDPDGVTFTAELDLTERGSRLQISSSLRSTSDLTPVEFVKGKSYRFVNVDAAVKVAGGMATVTNLGETKTFEAPRRFFTAQSYAPLSARAQLIRYWKQHGQPDSLAVMPGEPTRDVPIALDGYDTIEINGAKHLLSRYSVDGIVWGKETVWVDEAGRFAAIVSRIHILPLEAVRSDVKGFLPALQKSAIADRVSSLVTSHVDDTFALRGGKLIDGTGRAPIEDSVVVVRGGRIAAAGPRSSTRIPGAIRVIEAKGATIAPGLWDMHAHAAQVEWMPAYLAAGVTTIRDMGGETPFLTAVERLKGDVMKPRVLLAGLVDGDGPGGFGAVIAATPQQGRAIVDDPNAPQTRATIEMLAKKKIVFDPTLPWNELLGHAPETPLESLEPGFSHAPPALLANYRSVKNDTDAATAKRRVRDSEAMVNALFDAGVPIVAGTDGALPGYSLLRSIEMYVEAGMTPMQAIQSATRVPAEAMGLLKDTGTIEAGKRADLIVLNADPLASISNIRKLRFVVAEGRVMEPSKLWTAAGFK